MKAAAPGVGLDHALQYSNHRSTAEHLRVNWKRLNGDVRSLKRLARKQSAAHEIPKFRVSPLGTVIHTQGLDN